MNKFPTNAFQINYLKLYEENLELLGKPNFFFKWSWNLRGAHEGGISYNLQTSFKKEEQKKPKQINLHKCNQETRDSVSLP